MNFWDDEREMKRRESSIPVSTRISIPTLAKLIRVFEREGFVVRSISWAVSQGVEALVEKLEDAGIIEDITVAEAYREIEKRRLWQRSLKNRSKMKIAAAVRMEGIREGGKDPRVEDPRTFNLLHNKRSMNTKVVTKRMIPIEGYPQFVYEEGNEEQRIHIEKQIKLQQEKLKFMEKYKELEEEGRKKDLERLEREKEAAKNSYICIKGVEPSKRDEEEEEERVIKEGSSYEELNERQERIDRKEKEKWDEEIKALIERGKKK